MGKAEAWAAFSAVYRSADTFFTKTITLIVDNQRRETQRWLKEIQVLLPAGLLAVGESCGTAEQALVDNP